VHHVFCVLFGWNHFFFFPLVKFVSFLNTFDTVQVLSPSADWV
jgi:hypothetical protein